MNYHFDSKTGSFFMRDYETGKSWDNHIWNDKQFLCTVNQFGQSTTRLVTENAEIVFLGGNNGCYLRDDDSKDYWNIGFGPTFKAVEDYQCEHGLSFTEVSSRRGGIYASHAFTVAEDELEEMWKITVKNESNVIRHISVFAACHFNLNGFMQNRYYYAGNTGWTEFVPEVNGVFCRQKSPFMPVDMFSGYIIGSEPTNLHLGRAEHFTGTAGNLSVPRLLEMGLDLPGTDAAVRERCGMLQNKITLKPGEEKTLYYAMGFTSSSVHDLVAAKDRLMNNAVTFFDKRYERGIKEYGALRCHTPNERINNIMNFWVQKQVCYCMIGKKAVRDNAQIALGLLNFNTSLAKKNLTECLENQAFDGHALLTWSPFARESDIYSDPSAWLSIAVCEYIKESGDLDFLNEHIPFLDGEDGTVYDHLKKAAEWFMCKDNYGPHDLPRIHHADWNDALNIPDETAESVFMAALVCLTLQEIASLAQYIGAEDAYVESLLAFRKKVADATNEYAFNGDYYVRAFSKYGTVGDKSGTNGGNIYSNPQVWAILAGIVPEERLPKVLSTIDSIENKGGVPLCYAACLKAAQKLYDLPQLKEKASRIERFLRERAFDGQFFVDNLVRNDVGELEQTGLLTEVCQYYAFWLRFVSKEDYPALYEELMERLGTNRAEGYLPQVAKPIVMYGQYMRLDLMMRDGKRDELLEECKKLLLPMAERTGTLWEHNNICASCDHGFAAYSIKWLIYGLTGKDVSRTGDGK